MQKELTQLTEEQIQDLIPDEIEEPEEPETEPPATVHIGGLRPIRFDLVKGDPSLAFPVYAQSSSNGDVSLLLPKGSRISERIRRRIHAKYQGTVYIQTRDYSAYAEETEEIIRNLLSDESSDIQEKTPVFFSYATDRLSEAFRRISEEGGDQVNLVLPVAEHALKLIQQDWKASFSILKLARAEPHTYAHSLNVCFFGLSYVHNFLPGYSDKELKEITLGFLAHDIGELRISEKTLNKTSGLTPIERRVIEQVPLYGYQVLKEMGCDYPLAVDIVLNHHEREDGTGYPRGLQKHKIPDLAKVCAVCEAFDTMTTPQPYRPEALTPFEAFRTMLREKPGQFDVRILTKFIRMMGGHPQGGRNN